ncbi:MULTISPECIES: hypothetical protein [Calditerrivibrio]|uniref:Lipoprotein n=1 Tax=Calditerrivibrio nitroreducens TaxID=477976 RepID=A0A2J6WNH8_9BACT|nr:MAG: hypothetical protein C0187_02795 [Calditerrivibrio nitroreducens]
MRKLIYLSILVFFTGCFSSSFNYKTDKTLKQNFAYSQKTGDMVLYYNIKFNNTDKVLDINIKNVSNMFIKGLSLDITDDSGKLNKYLYVGNIKNLNSKTISLEVDKNLSKLYISFKYEIMPEDAFLNPNISDNGLFEKTEKTILIIK